MHFLSIVSTVVFDPTLSGQLLVSLLVVVGLLFGLHVRGARRRLHRASERVLILGDSPLGRQVVDEIERRPHRRCAIVDVLDSAQHLGSAIEATRPDRIVIALPERRGRLPVSRLLESRARGIVVEDVVETYERLTGKVALEALVPSSVIFSHNFKMSQLQLSLSRLLSLSCSVMGLIALAPVFGLIAVVIKLGSRGPVFFVQERVGLYGRCFKLLKFRTMQPVDRPRSEWERDNCDRITRPGRWLRRFRLDELPQLVNVLRGDMNLVGPRPHPVTNLELLIRAGHTLSEMTGDPIPYYSLRCSVRPGITGWAQIHYGYANSLEEETEKIRYDFYYLKHMSFWLDVRILVQTIKTVFSGQRPTDGHTRRRRRREVFDEPMRMRGTKTA
jgi:exopolysaccharide biosynthesis polyprenyl glycosylphosphotransferase